jgi:hypothetical protein
MPFVETAAVYCENHTEHTDAGGTVTYRIRTFFSSATSPRCPTSIYIRRDTAASSINIRGSRIQVSCTWRHAHPYVMAREGRGGGGLLTNRAKDPELHMLRALQLVPAAMKKRKISYLCWESNPDPSAVQPVAIWETFRPSAHMKRKGRLSVWMSHTRLRTGLGQTDTDFCW